MTSGTAMTEQVRWEDMPAWEQRLRARRVGLPDWADEAADRCAVVATTEEGVVETHSWSPGTQPVQLTRRPDGTSDATIDPNGEWVWWFDDTNGDEYGVWRRQPFGAAPGEQVDDPTGLPAAYSAGLDLGRSGLVVVGSNDDDYGTQIHALLAGQGSPRVLYAHRETAYVGGLSHDETLLAISHSEHGDSRHPALRVVSVADGSTIGELWDGPGRSLRPAGFAPVTGDQRLLVIHERAGVPGLLLWDPVADPAGADARELAVAAPGEVTDVDWFPTADALLVALDHQARTRLWRLDLADGTTAAVGPDSGTVSGAGVRPDGEVWLSWSSASRPPAIRSASGDVVLEPLGPPAPGSVAVQDVWADGPGGPVHALLRVPTTGAAPYPTVFEVHGGPEWHDLDAFAGYASAYVDQGYAVVNVNYRGSTGYGTAWRDAIGARIGHTELADVLAVREHLVQAGVVDPDRVALSGSSWGGYLTLLGLGTQPTAWTVGVASVPVADYVAAYEDEMEALKAFDRALFGGAPDQVPDRYVDSSPITYVESVRAPLLVLAGENDPRCPIRQVDNYLARLTELSRPPEVYRFDAGHGSMVNDERVAQLRVELDFLARHLAPA
jgi:dipeptidyl aminopeptidase/acylaminoacyl peptidase